ncbi:hypothetical protein ANN_08267 [Periplaneta americana]|uniref:Uncharacterized protein n=1 Tax=Periplaneta americana TaxID=6978 RepID=A0ABQ8T0Y2_PERAM|nr:hypothetical protein ANN_08267 [Periplaneta americana]
MSPGSSTESYPAFAHIGLRENPGKILNQVTCPDRESNPGHLILRPDALAVTPQLEWRNFTLCDGAPPHFGRHVRNHLNATFPDRWIGRGGPVTWPPRSPDLTALDSFLWGDV